MLMTIAPGMLLSIITIFFNLAVVVLAVSGIMSTGIAVATSLSSVFFCLFNYTVVMFLFGALTTFTEWDNILASTSMKIRSMFTFPLFMLTYIPIALVALVKKATWKPIKHNITLSMVWHFCKNSYSRFCTTKPNLAPVVIIKNQFQTFYIYITNCFVSSNFFWK